MPLCSFILCRHVEQIDIEVFELTFTMESNSSSVLLSSAINHAMFVASFFTARCFYKVFLLDLSVISLAGWFLLYLFEVIFQSYFKVLCNQTRRG
ncbi:uncharacterized protein LOC120114205 isoform X2 [Hibiscus syriacus]|uniref:uncharacterized protein LOC120114205 isoform X2 n=1 Tax=Hibiscus syriacus TaxID=106335 RepID=UPI001921EC87|nr:uncharacterized protein LOC120114205 isoform X2 [Hibiscus syriacus]